MLKIFSQGTVTPTFRQAGSNGPFHTWASVSISSCWPNWPFWSSVHNHISVILGDDVRSWIVLCFGWPHGFFIDVVKNKVSVALHHCLPSTRVSDEIFSIKKLCSAVRFEAQVVNYLTAVSNDLSLKLGHTGSCFSFIFVLSTLALKLSLKKIGTAWRQVNIFKFQSFVFS